MLPPDPKTAELFSANPPGVSEGGDIRPLGGAWQMQFLRGGESGSRFPIPPQFGAPADLIQKWPFSKSE